MIEKSTQDNTPNTPTCRGRQPGRVGMRVAQVYTAVATSLLIPSVANAKISDWFTNIGTEVAVIVPILIVILGAAGILMAGFGIISAVMAKKNQRPLEHQHWLIIGGVLCVLLIPFVLGMSESISGQDAGGNVEGFLEGDTDSANW